MAIFFTNWLKKTFSPKPEKARKCLDSEKCLSLLQLILDGEASDFETHYFNTHIEDCMSCFEHYNLEKTIRQVLKTKVEKRPVPIDLVQTIKLKITQTA
ncbi:MAG: anti-sigma factor [Bacteroidota bacterium]|nr:anti-sigma factor [Bacteroidota bacterium]